MTEPTPAAAVALRVLGPLTATVGGAPADLGGRRQRAVLARLAAAGGQVVSTDRLIEDLWEGEPPAKALAVLQVHVSHLRRVLEPDRPRRAPASVLVSAAPGYALRLPAGAVDAWWFEALLRRAADAPPAARRDLLTEALDSWHGPAYAESADAAWAAPEAARLLELRLGAVEARAEAELALGRPAAAIPELERHLHDHPAREEAVRLLALALYRSGRQGEALAALRRAREHLADELGIDPGPALRSLEGDILGQSPGLQLPAAAPPIPAAATVPAPPPAPEPATPVSALGRAIEMDAVAAAAEEARAAGLRLAWVAADAGQGKTTFAEAVTEPLRARGWTVAWGSCPEVDGAPPGWAWAEVLRALPGDAESDERLAPVLQPGSAGANAFWLAQAAAERLQAALAAGPVVIVLDDVHRADSVTLQLLRQVAGLLAERPVLVLATYRRNEIGEELGATIGALVGVTAAHQWLDGLEPATVRVLAREFGLDASDEVAALLAERTGGNPLYVRELVKLMVAEGAAGPGRARTVLPVGVREVIRRRLARLPDSTLIVLRQAAVLGREVDVDLLAEVARRDPDELLEALETAVLAGLLDEPAPGLVRFAHALVRDTLYEDTPLLRRTRLHAAALAALRAGGHADATTLAHHAAAAAGPANALEAVPYVVAAAREADAIHAYADAARQWTTALRLRELAERRGPAGPDAGLLDLLLPAVRSLARADDATRARPLYVRGVEIARASGDRDLAMRALTAWDAPLIFSTRPARASSSPVLDAARERLADPGTTPAERSRLWVAVFLEVEGDDDAAALEASAEALRLAREEHATGAPGADRLLCAALNVRAYAALGPDLLGERRAVTEEYLEVASSAGIEDHQAVARWLMFLEAASRTDLVAAQEHVGRAVAIAGSGQIGSLLGVLALFSGVVDIMAGRVDEGVARFEQVSAAMSESGTANGETMAVVGRVGGATARGDLGPRAAELAAIEAMIPGGITDVLVLALLDAGREAEARAAWRGRVPIARNYYWLGMTTFRAHASARLGELDVARETYAELLPYTGRIGGIDSGTLYAGPVDAALAALAAALGDDEAAAEHRKASAAALEHVASQLIPG